MKWNRTRRIATQKSRALDEHMSAKIGSAANDIEERLGCPGVVAALPSILRFLACGPIALFVMSEQKKFICH